MKLKKIVAVAGALCLVSLSGLAQAQTSASKSQAPVAVPMPKTDRMSMADFKKLQATGDVVIIDVRSTDSYASGHIPGALSMPEETLSAPVAEKLKRMGKPVATYCAWQAEHTSARAAQTLQKMGVPAQALVGGFNQWVQDKNPVKSGPNPK